MIKGIVFDFDGVFTNNYVFCGPAGEELVVCSKADSLGVTACLKAGIILYILSTEVSPVVALRAKKMGVPYMKGVSSKIDVFKRWLEQNKLDPKEVIYMGNDVNDLDCLKYAGLGIVTQDAHPDVVKIANYRTDDLGGAGAVREVCDMLLKGDFEDDLYWNNSR